MRFLLIVACLAGFGFGLTAQSAGDDHTKRAIEIYDKEGVDKAHAYIAALRPLTAMQVTVETSNHVYWQRRKVDDYVKLVRLGLAEGEQAAEKLKAASTADHRRILGWLQALNVNLAVNMWRGWGTSGITITDDQVATGLEAASRNLELVGTLKLDAAHRYRAHWTRGALLLSVRKDKDALLAFGMAKSHALKARDPLLIVNAELYTAWTKLLIDPSLGTAEIDSLVEQLNRLKGGKAYTGQFATARRLLFK